VIRIRGEKVTLRPFRPEELDLLLTAYRSPDPPAGVRRLSRDAVRRRIERSGRLVRGRLELGIEAEGRLVGDLDARSPAHAFPPGVFEIGVSVFAVDDRGKGYGLEATRLLVDHLFDAEKAARVQATTADWNAPMRALLARLGFSEEGVLRAFFPTVRGRDDYVMCSLTRNEWLEAADGSKPGEAGRA
jgi:[ribosomal protein S5]-alanine N-acetyltransferase